MRVGVLIDEPPMNCSGLLDLLAVFEVMSGVLIQA